MGTKVRKKTMKMAAWVKIAKKLRETRPWTDTAMYVTAVARQRMDHNYGDKLLCIQFDSTCLAIADMLAEDDPAFKNCQREFFATCGLERKSEMVAIREALADPDVKPWA